MNIDWLHLFIEGCNFVDSLPRKDLAKNALSYIEIEKSVRELQDTITLSNLPEQEKELIVDLLKRGGVRTSFNNS